MKLKSMQDLYLDMLRDIYYAENQLTKALPKMARATTNMGLQQAVENHLLETNTHIERLERVFQALEQEAKGKKCEAILGLIKEAEDLMDHAGTQDVMDAAIIAAAQKVEHYEIATYGTLVAFARLLGYPDQARVLMDTLKEERLADEKLTTLAESGINCQAAA